MADAVENKKNIAEGVPTVTLTIDGRETTVPKGTTVLMAARGLGIHIPTFCWHPKLKPMGSCRMCYVEIEKMPKLQVSCALEAMDGMVVLTDSDLVKRGRRAIIEFILMNHPLDCPTCDKGGECDLQDQTFAHGVDDSRFDFQKYRFTEGTEGSTFDDLRIGPEIVLNRNRCILCYKCVRANKEAFGEYDLGAYERGNIMEIHRAPGRQVDNPFSGNLVEICPVGALTNTDWRYKIRVWLTQTTSSICPFSSSGVNTLLYKDDHQQKIFRTTSRPNDDIDDGWLADVTRYGYQIATSPDRLQTPLIKKDGQQVPATWKEALEIINKRLNEIKDKKGRVCIGGIVSPSLDNATLHSFSKLIRVTLGSNNIDYRTQYRMLPKEPENVYDAMSARSFKISDIDDSDVIVAFGSDLVKEHPNEYLRIRKACNFHSASVYSVNPYRVKSADVARREMIYKVGTEEVFLNGLCLAAIEAGMAEGGDLKEKISPSTAAEAAAICGVDAEHLKELAAAMANGRKVTFIAGELVSRSRERLCISSALANLTRLLGLENKGQVSILPHYANSFGAGKLGLLPQPPEGIRNALTELWGAWPEAEPLTTDGMLINMKKEEVNGCIALGCNPVMLYPDREFARESLEKLDFLLVADLYETETTGLADVVLPLASWAEYDGRYINLEGRVQRANRALKPRFESKPGYEIVEAIAEQIGDKLYESSDQCEQEISRLVESSNVQPLPDKYFDVRPAEEESDEEYPIALFVGDDPHHSGHLTEKANSLFNFCGEAYIEMSSELAKKLDLKEGDSARVESKVGKIIVPVRISTTINNDVVFIPRNFSSTTVTALLMRKKRTDRVKISKVVN
ncbi:MAG: NADH-quinone oxidoreductase subunit NuoG [bacterium]|nr:NADH-quinone oxidoreductase subunit NuoG [bacterium]